MVNPTMVFLIGAIIFAALLALVVAMVGYDTEKKARIQRKEVGHGKDDWANDYEGEMEGVYRSMRRNILR